MRRFVVLLAAITVTLLVAGVASGAWNKPQMEAWYAKRAGVPVADVGCGLVGGAWDCTVFNGKNADHFYVITPNGPRPQGAGWPRLMTPDALEAFYEAKGLYVTRPTRRLLKVLSITCSGQGYSGPAKPTRIGLTEPTYSKFLCSVDIPGGSAMIHVDLTLRGPTWQAI